MTDPIDDHPDPLRDLGLWQSWVGRVETAHDHVGAAPLAALAATLDRDEPEPGEGDAAPPLAHWLYFLPRTRQSGLGPDGHALRGGFLPPVPLPRRMWAGGRIDFERPLRVGEAITRRSRIAAVDGKRGRSGSLAFVTVRHEVLGPAGRLLAEEHDIVYREAPRAGAAPAPPRPAPADAAYARTLVPDAVLLFRYSALTFNGHRIHYDRRYVTEVEGYPGLIVHGPLIATLLVDLLRRERPQARLTHFAFTAVAPVFDDRPLQLCGRPAGEGRDLLWAADPDGALAMQAEAHWA